MNRPTLFISLVCCHTRNPGVGRFVWTGSYYSLVGASRQRPGSVVPDEGQEQIEAEFTTAPDYQGCPGCGAGGFVRCGRCLRLACWEDSWEIFHCPRCGNSGPVTGTIDRLSDLGTG
jgi:hypothetical protein